MENWKQVAGGGGGSRGRTLKILRLHAANPFLKLHKVEDTELGKVVNGSEVLRVISRECAKKYPKHNKAVPSDWVAWLVERQVASSRVEQVADAMESRDTGRVLVASLINIKVEFSNKTPRVDCIVPCLLKLFGLRTASQFAHILNVEFEQWPGETKRVLHMTLHKSRGFNMNKNTRPIKVVSALVKIQAKLLAPMVQTLTTFPSITQALATKGAVGVMVLDIVGAYDEVMR